MEPTALKENFKAYQKKMRAYNHAMGVLQYDFETVMPKGGAEGMGETLGILSEESYKLSVSDELRAMIAELLAQKDALDFQTRREAEELLEDIEKIEKIPMEEYVAFEKLTNKASFVWHSAKPDNDYKSFEPFLAEIIEFQKRFAKYIKPELPAYDALLDGFERGMTQAMLDPYFKNVRESLVPLIHEIGRAKQPDMSFLERPYALDKQRAFSDYLMEVMCIDRSHCSIGEVEHPFTTEFNKHDVRITTHYHEDMMHDSMYSVIHEGGHALYELHTGDDLIGSVLAGGASMGIHESQSRFYENIIGRSEPFIEYIFPKMREIFPSELTAVTPHEFFLAVNKCTPSLIRTQADELTYSLHIMVRYELEKRLIGGSLSTKDLPEAWNAMYKEYLGITVPSDREGVLQDSHWSGGMFGYFPSYSVGSAYAAQMLSSMQKELDVWNLVSTGELAPIIAWLTERIYKHGMLLKPNELVQNACGAPFDPKYYTDYLTKKFRAIYSI
ncbi:MAG: carboxypeptidase M32 [Clostridiaceae bacterium]